MSAIETLNMSPASRAALGTDALQLLDLAVSLQGRAALVATRDHAARHEAGHAVAYRAAGQRVLSVAVFKRGDDWLGRTVAGRAWTVSGSTHPADDLAQAQILLAGPMAEWTGNAPSLGGGVDEISVARGIASEVARKTGASPEEVMLVLMRSVLSLLREYQPVIDGLADVLARERKIKNPRLARMLRPVLSHN